MSAGYCEECKKGCEGQIVDFGIGPYEFWGRVGVDKQEAWVSLCCEATIFDDDTFQVEAELPEPPEREYERLSSDQ